MMKTYSFGLFRRPSAPVPLDYSNPAVAAEAFADVDVDDILTEPFVRSAVAIERAALVEIARSDETLRSAHREREVAIVRFRRAVGADNRPAATPPSLPSFGDPVIDRGHAWANTARAESAYRTLEDASQEVALAAEATTSRLDVHAAAFRAGLEQYLTLANSVRHDKGRPDLPGLPADLADDLVADAMRRARATDEPA
jgi:hypothetical protein